MAKYKPDQGVYARTTSFMLLGAMAVFGAYTLFYWLLSFRGDADEPGGLATELSSGPLPVLSLPLTPALMIASAVGLASLWILNKLLNRQKSADILIESETEMRKCTWPSVNETITSSIVILVVMLFFTFALAGMDWFLNNLMSGVVFS
jgi:preprotein translocase SecE subunit